MFIWPKRIFFFIAVNFLIVLTLSFVAQLLIRYFNIEVNQNSLYFILIFYSIIGMGGAFIHLWISKWIAVKTMRVRIVSTRDPQTKALVEKVQQLSVKAGLPKYPEVGIYESPEINAFATGPSKSNSLVAVSTALLNQMNEEEVEGVLAHEIAHIANGDMVTMSLIQGIVNTMVFIISHILSRMIINILFKNRDPGFFVEMMIRNLVCSLVYIPASTIVYYFSRVREYRADKGGAKFAGSHKMISALQALQTHFQSHKKQQTEYNYLMINTKTKKSLLMRLFSTHPPLEDRIKRLKRGPALI